MGSKSDNASLALFFSLNLLFFAFASAQCAPPPPPTPTPSPPPPPPPPPPTLSPPTGTCPIDVLKLGVCANLLGLINVIIGGPPVSPCCSLIQGLVDLEAAVCLCTAIRANILGINLNVPLTLSLILNKCGKTTPTGFQCP